MSGQDQRDSPRKNRTGGCFRWLFVTLFGGMGGLGVVALVLLVAAVFGVRLANDLLGDLGSLLNPPPPRASVVSTQTILTGIQPLGQLVSVAAQVAKADITVGVQEGVLNVCSHSASHVAQGTVEAGISLAFVTADDIQYDPASDTYHITVPAPQLTSCRVEFIRQYDRSFTTCPVDWDAARVLANYQAISEFRDDAVAGGVLERARQETTVLLANFVHALTGSNAEINYSLRFNPGMPPSCIPEEPIGWTYVQSDEVWVKR